MKCLHCGSENPGDLVQEETSLGAIAHMYLCNDCGRFIAYADEDDDLREDFPYGYDALDARRSKDRPPTRGEQ